MTKQNRLVEVVQQRLAHLQLGVLVRQHVQLLQLAGDALGDLKQLLGWHDLVEEAGIQGILGLEHLGIDHRAVEGRATQAVACQFDAGVVHGHADLHFVQADLVRPFDADAVVGRQQQESALGHGMAGAGDDHRERVRQQAAGQGGTGGDQGDGLFRARRHHLEVVATREDAWLAGDDHHGAFLRGAVEGGIEGRDDIRRDGVDLAVVQGQGGDAVFGVVGNQLAHGAILRVTWRRRYPAPRAR